MAYIAQHYVNLDGVMVMPGETIEGPIDAKKEKWLLEQGAIRKKVAPDSFYDDEEDHQTDATGTSDPDQYDAENGSDEDAEDDSEDSTEEDSEDTEEYEDTEPPEIDVADSITSSDEEPADGEEKPTRKRGGGKEKK